MLLLSGRRARNLKEAFELVRNEMGINDVSPESISQFLSMADGLRRESEKAIDAAVHKRYHSRSTWHGEWWHIPVPQLRYDSREMPQISIEVQIYLVAEVVVKTKDGNLTLTLVDTLGRPEIIIIPIFFLQGLLEEDLGGFKIVAKSASHTTYEVVLGIKPIELPNEFVDDLVNTLRRNSIVDWLVDFGEQGRRIAPLAAGCLLGLLFADEAKQIPVSNQGWTTEQLVSAAEGMAYKPREAKEMVNKALPYLKPEHNLEEAIKIMLRQGAKENSDGI